MAEEEKAAEKKPAAKKKEEGPVKRPSAQKRDLQSEKRRLRNRSYRATVLTSVRDLQNSISQKEAPEAIKTKLNAIYSLVDKGVKRGVFKPQKAARTKSRLTARAAKA
ncbi:MAG TPA: 30S ribosomal protein S20 [Chlamydiales bacterium]|nr:30S ribosomal protein S20 [Chlamydiales bacterium]